MTPPQHRPSLQERALLLAVWTCLPLAILGAYQIYSAYEASMSRFQEEVRIWRDATATGLQAYRDQTERALAVFARQIQETPSDPASLSRAAALLCAGREEHRSLTLLDAAGRIVMTTETGPAIAASPKWIPSALAASGFQVNRMFAAGSNSWLIPMVQPVFDAQRNRMGTLVLMSDPNQFTSILLTKPMDRQRTVMVLEEGGRVLLHSGLVHLGELYPLHASFFRDHDRGITQGESPGFDKVPRLYSSVRIRGTTWVMRASATKPDVTGAILGKVGWSLALLTLSTLATLAGARRVAASLARPARALATAARDQAAGRRVARLDESGPAEIADTARAFNEMVEQRRSMEQGLKDSEEKYRVLVENAAEMILVIQDRQMVFANTSAAAVLGCAPGEIPPRPFDGLVHPDDRAMVTARHEARNSPTPPPSNYSFRLLNTSGQTRWVDLNVVGISWKGRPATLNFLNDTTDRVLAEREQEKLRGQLQQAQKMEALGTLAGGIAHDFNNLLAAILGNAELARQDVGPGHPADESLEEIQKTGRRARDLVQRILAFSRPQEPTRRPILLQDLMDEVIRMLKPMLPASVEMRLECDPDTPQVLADAGQIHQALINLGTNAWQALEDRPGLLRFRLSRWKVDAAMCAVHKDLRPGLHARLSVSDNGRGMDASILERVFEPFFTTKPPGRGTGLGLSMVHGIMKAHSGAVTVESQPGVGSTFHLFFPAAAPTGRTPSEEGPRPAPHATSGGGRSILYIDDEEPMVYLAGRILERMGYRFSGHTTAADGLNAFRQQPGQFDLVITDLSMPGMSGMDLARVILGIRPETRVVVASGFLRPEDIAQARAIGVLEVIDKPDTVEELGPVVSRILQKSQNGDSPETHLPPR